MPKGRVKAYNPVKGYGTILTEDGQEIFVHGSAIQAEGLKVLEAGQKVKFEIAQGPQGLLAANVRKMVDRAPGEESTALSPPSPARGISPRSEVGGGETLSGIPPGAPEERTRSSSLLSLPRFTTDPIFARLRTLMGATRLGSFSPPPVTPLAPLAQDHVSAEEMADLASQGLEVVEGDVRLLTDGTLAFKNRRVLLYIRTPNSSVPEDLDIDESWRAPRRWSFGAEDSGPRFHIANCRTLESMRQSGRGHRYVVSTRTDGQFELVSPGGSVTTRSLRVCKNCLERLDWKGFVRVSGADRDRRVDAFSLEEFFEAYGRAL
jgi:cold shock CspA family protein